MSNMFFSIDILDNYRLFEVIYEDKSDFTYKIYNKKYGNKPLKVYTSSEDLHSMDLNEIWESEAYAEFQQFVTEKSQKERKNNRKQPNLKDWYQKDLFGNIVPKNNYFTNYYKPEPEVVNEDKVRELSKSDTIVFHLTDPSTTMLSQIYKGKGYDEVHSHLNSPTVAALLDNHTKVICLGHGTSGGLIGMFGTDIRKHFKDKNLFVIWCNADKYFDNGNLGQGAFITGNMPSEVWECRAAGCGKISTELMLENITYWSKLCADALPQCLEGNVAEAVDYIRREYIKKYGDHPVTHYNAVRTMVHGDSYEKAEQEVKAIEDELNIHPNWDKYNPNESKINSVISQKIDFNNINSENLNKDSANIGFFETNKDSNIKNEELNMKEKTKICCLCGKEYKGYGNNALPLHDGKCCNECNSLKVIPARLKEWQQNRKTNEELNESNKHIKFVRISHDDEIYNED